MAQIQVRLTGVTRAGKRFARVYPDGRRGDAQRDAARLLWPDTIRYRWYIRYRLDGRTVRETLGSRNEATRREREVETQKERGEAISPKLGKMQFDELARQWLSSDPSKRPSTLARDRAIVENHLIPAFESKRIGSIKYDDIQIVVNRWAKTEAPMTVIRQFAALRALFAYAVRSGKLYRSPCNGIRLPENEPVRQSILVPPDVVNDLAEIIGPMVYFGAVMGLRWAEAAGLRVSDLDLDDGTLFVSHQRTRGEHGEMIYKAPKSKKGTRLFAMPPKLVAIVSEYIETNDLSEDDYLFAGPRGAPLHYSNWRRRVWKPATEAVGAPGLRFHDLRTLNTTALIELGVDVKTVQTRLGHSSARTTLDIYAKATREGDRNAAIALGGHFFPT
jgi:integrase